MDLNQRFTVVLREEPEGGFTVRVPALPEIVTYGSDEAEALAMAKEAIELAVEVRVARGEEVFEPSMRSAEQIALDAPGSR